MFSFIKITNAIAYMVLVLVILIPIIYFDYISKPSFPNIEPLQDRIIISLLDKQKISCSKEDIVNNAFASESRQFSKQLGETVYWNDFVVSKYITNKIVASNISAIISTDTNEYIQANSEGLRGSGEASILYRKLSSNCFLQVNIFIP